MILRESSEDDSTTTFCIPCFDKCKSCYFGNNDVNLNGGSWNSYNNKEGLYTKDFLENQSNFFEQLFFYHKLA